MPLTDEPVVLKGGCNCRAIRYQVSIPAKTERPFYPGGGADSKPPVHTPVICTDHCNDCRSATGSILPCWLLAPIAMVSTSLIDTKSVGLDGRIAAETPRGPWRPAAEVFTSERADPTTFLSFFASSKGRRRSFCSRCGTMFAYQVYPSPSGFLPMLDIVLGTIDRDCLDDYDLSPERQLWWDCGIKWVRDFATQGLKVPVNPSWTVDAEVEGQ